MRVLFVNPPHQACGVNQFGARLFECLGTSQINHYRMLETEQSYEVEPVVRAYMPHVIIWNYHPGASPWMIPEIAQFKATRFREFSHLLVYHDGDLHEWMMFDAILFSDPTMPQHENWYPIGRPLPYLAGWSYPHNPDLPWIGVNGFLGAWAHIAVQRIIQEFDKCVIRLHLPSSHYMDPAGAQAQASARQCMDLAKHKPGISFEIKIGFMEIAELVDYLAQNDLNVYMRDLPPSFRGVSSVLDPALAARVPIATNRCICFRHVFGLNPTIQVEDLSLRQIMGNGTKPLEPLYQEWSHENICRQVETVLARVCP